jgi:hypothetical protein
VYSTQYAQTTLDAGKALSQANLFSSRYALIDQKSRDSFQVSIAQTVLFVKKDVFSLQEIVRFYGTVLVDPTQIATFLTKNSKNDLVYLFTKRRTITSIDFSVSNDTIISLVNQVLAVQNGNTSTSAILANSQPLNSANIDSTIDITNKQLVASYCAGYQLNIPHMSFLNLSTAISCLQTVLSNQIPVASSSVVQGYQSFDSPAAVLVMHGDLIATLNTTAITNALESLVKKYTGNFKVVIEILANLITQIQNAFFQATQTLRATVSSLISKIQSFISQFMAMHGTPGIDSSLLKCSANFSLSATLPVFGDLGTYLDSMVNQVSTFLASLFKIVSDFVEMLLCLPLNFFNGFMSGVQNSLPSVCSTYKLNLPSDITSLLIQIKNGFQLQSNAFSAFGRDLVRLTASVQSTPQKLTQFQQNLACQNTASAALFNGISKAVG